MGRGLIQKITLKLSRYCKHYTFQRITTLVFCLQCLFVCYLSEGHLPAKLRSGEDMCSCEVQTEVLNIHSEEILFISGRFNSNLLCIHSHRLCNDLCLSRLWICGGYSSNGISPPAKPKLSAPLANFQGTYELVICTTLLKFWTCTIVQPTYGGQKLKSFQIMKFTYPKYWTKRSQTQKIKEASTWRRSND
jgi:hypothetical protein